MFLTVISVLAVVFTVLRTWPQFIRIVIKKDHAGVSTLTWMIALANHTGWAMYGALSPVYLFILSNLLAGAGCAATVWAMRSWKSVAAIFAGSAAIALALFEIKDAALLVVVNGTAFGMFLPQLVSVFRSNPEGVSPTAWAMAAIASATWLGYGFAIHRPTVVLAHFLMFPASLAILARTIRVKNLEVVREDPAAA